jgi:hypothetical protein
MRNKLRTRNATHNLKKSRAERTAEGPFQWERVRVERLM